jgi:ABC-2 type transport system permease protein
MIHMKRFFHHIKLFLLQTAQVCRREWHLVLHDAGVLVFFLLLPLAYPIVYTLIYNPEVVEQLPFAVVDNCRTAESRELVREADATSAMKLAGYAADLGEAKRWMAEGKVYGIMEIPDDYSQCLARGEQAVVPFYYEMSLLLRYRTFLSALTDVQMATTAHVTMQRVAAFGAEDLVTGLPVNSESHMLGDTQQGFASFVMPGIVVLILQQSMVLGIAMLAGTAAQRRRRNTLGIDPEAVEGAGAFATIWGKTLCYVVLYIPLTIYILRFIPMMFNLPHAGSPVDYLLFALPLLIASAFFGQTVSHACRHREDSFLIFVFTSVVFLFLSGLTWPRFAMPVVWQWLGAIVPSTWGVEGFIRINTNAATLAETSGPYISLWLLAAAYMLCAYALCRLNLRRQPK